MKFEDKLQRLSLYKVHAGQFFESIIDKMASKMSRLWRAPSLFARHFVYFFILNFLKISMTILMNKFKTKTLNIGSLQKNGPFPYVSILYKLIDKWHTEKKCFESNENLFHHP